MTIRMRLALTTIPGVIALAGAAQARAAIEVASNPAFISIPAAETTGVALPYPSTITIAATGVITEVNVSILGFRHTAVQDVGALLVGPGGQSVVLFDFVGSGTVSGVNWTFDDGATMLPFGGPPPTGTYSPTNYEDNIFPAPAPGGAYGSALSVFNGTNLAGTWSLYVNDFIFGDSGAFAGGWSLSITYDDGTTGEVPEPASLLAWSLFGATTVGIIKLRRRRSRG